MGDPDQHLSAIARGGALGLAGSAVSAGCTFLVVIVVTKLVDQSTAGHFFALTSFFLLVLAFCELGTEAGLGRFMLRFEALGRGRDLPQLYRAAAVPALVAGSVVALGCLLALGPISGVLGVEDGRSGLAACALALPVVVLGYTGLSGTRAFGRMRTSVLADSIVRPIGQLLAVALMGAVGAGLLGLVVGWLVGYVAAAVVGLLVFRVQLTRRVGRHTDAAGAAPMRAGLVWREFWSYTWARGVARVAQMALQRLDIVLIAAILGAKEAAVYTAATRFVALGQFPAQAIQQVVQPRFTAMVANEDRASLRQVYEISTAWGMAVSWPVYVVVGVAPGVYLSLFGTSYEQAGVAVVLWMTVGMLAALATGPADTLLLMSGGSVASLVISVVVLAVDVVGCVLLLPRVGIVGAAFSWALALFVRQVLGFALVRRAWEVRNLSPATLTVVLANAAFAVPLALLVHWLEPNIWALGLLVVACAPVYLAVLHLGRKPLRLPMLRAALLARGGDR